LTYPFVDAVVGKNPAQARNLHMGDYTNLSAQLDLDLGAGPQNPLPTDVCKQDPTGTLCNPGQVLTDLQKCLMSGDLNSAACKNIGVQKLIKACKKPANKKKAVCQAVNKLPLSNATGQLGTALKKLAAGGSGGSGGSGPSLPLPPGTLPGVPRAPYGSAQTTGADEPGTADSDLGALLVWGMMQR
jgi:phospholipid/cholesterol/gamma-HCH transport system substrate-binding protein